MFQGDKTVGGLGTLSKIKTSFLFPFKLEMHMVYPQFGLSHVHGCFPITLNWIWTLNMQTSTSCLRRKNCKGFLFHHTHHMILI